MNQPTTQPSFSPPWFLIIGIVAGILLIGFVAWDAPARKSAFLVELTETNWQKEVLESDVPVLVDFTAKWCGPCKALAPSIERLAERYQGRAKIAKFDVGDPSFDKARSFAERYGFAGVPHLMVFHGGRPIFEHSGADISESTLAKTIDKALASR